jgi:hypothetical protein
VIRGQNLRKVISLRVVKRDLRRKNRSQNSILIKKNLKIKGRKQCLLKTLPIKIIIAKGNIIPVRRNNNNNRVITILKQLDNLVKKIKIVHILIVLRVILF